MQNRNLLFVHIPKNAGKSIEVALQLPGKTPLRKLGRRSRMNRLFTLLQRATANPDSRRLVHGSLDITLCAQHLTLQEIQLLELLPIDAWPALRTFAVCRNPWARAFSSYKHFVSEEPNRDGFEAFCNSWYDRPPKDHNMMAHQRRQIDFIRNIKGDPGVERILRFESLESDFNTMCIDWDLGSPSLPHIGKQGGGASYRDLYTPMAKVLVAKRFAEDIEFFNYEF